MARTSAGFPEVCRSTARPDRLVAFCSFNPLREYALGKDDGSDQWSLSSCQWTSATFQGTSPSGQWTSATFQGTSSSGQWTSATFQGTRFSCQWTSATFQGTSSLCQRASSSAHWRKCTAHWHKCTAHWHKRTAHWHKFSSPWHNFSSPWTNSSRPWRNIRNPGGRDSPGSSAPCPKSRMANDRGGAPCVKRCSHLGPSSSTSSLARWRGPPPSAAAGVPMALPHRGHVLTWR